MIGVAILAGLLAGRLALALSVQTLGPESEANLLRQLRWPALRLTLIDIASAAAWVMVLWRFGHNIEGLVVLTLVFALTALSLVDLYSYRLPDRLIFRGLGVTALLMLVGALRSGDFAGIQFAAIGMCGYCGFLLLVHLLSPRGLGFGDVKLALLLGQHLGWLAGINGGDASMVVGLIFWTQVLASLGGLVTGVTVALLRSTVNQRMLADPQRSSANPKRLLAQSFPFGPVLAVATLMVMLFVGVATDSTL